jgi:GntR family transcriptional repressor for pyruvate dehydrogenase complex
MADHVHDTGLLLLQVAASGGHPFRSLGSIDFSNSNVARSARTPSCLGIVVQNILLMKDEIANDGIGIAGDNTFHDSVAKAAENKAMGRILEMCGDLLAYTRQAVLMIAGQPQKSLEDHQGILEAIRRKDDYAASHRMGEHFTNANRNLQSS